MCKLSFVLFINVFLHKYCHVSSMKTCAEFLRSFQFDFELGLRVLHIPNPLIPNT